MMTWTKVTDALPPDGEAVMVTVLVHHPFSDAKDDFKLIKHDAFYRANERRWYLRVDDAVGWMPDDCTVTHWAPMPAPAEDEEDL